MYNNLIKMELNNQSQAQDIEQKPEEAPAGEQPITNKEKVQKYDLAASDESDDPAFKECLEEEEFAKQFAESKNKMQRASSSDEEEKEEQKKEQSEEEEKVE